MFKAIEHIATASVCVLVLLLFRYVQTTIFSRLRRLPGPPLARLTAFYRALLICSGSGPAHFYKLHIRYGPLVRTGPKHVIVSDFAAVSEIFNSRTIFLKSRFYDTFSPLYDKMPMDTVFSTRDSARNKALKLPLVANLTGPFHLFRPIVDETINSFIEAMRHSNERTVNFGEWAQYYAFDVTSHIIFGSPYGFIKKGGDIEGLLGVTNLGLRYAAIIGQVPELHPWLIGNTTIMSFMSNFPSFPKPDAMLQEAEKLFHSHNLEHHNCGNTLLCRLAASDTPTIKRGSRNMDSINLLFETFFAASTEVAVSLATIFYFLVTNRASYERLVHEIRCDEDSKIFDVTDMADDSVKMPYLDAVIKEAMRLYPANGVPLERIVPRSGLNVRGHHIPEGTVVGVSPYAIHRDPEIYGAQVDMFCPERWLEPDMATKNRMEKHYLAFGRGTRQCPGRSLGMLEMRMLILQILRRFDVEWASGSPRYKMKMYWLTEHHHLDLRFRARSSSALTLE